MRRSALGITAAAAAMVALDVRDRRAVAKDPLTPLLYEAPEGEAHEVTSADGTRLHVESYGPADAPPVVLVHGWVCALSFWRLQVRDLARDHRVVAYDLRGHGRSGRPDGGDFSPDALADDLEAVLEQVVGDGPALLAGHSLGAMTIVAWSGRHPDSVRRRASAVALLNTGIGDLVSESLLVRTPKRFSKVDQTLGAAALGAGAPLPPWPSPVSHRAVRYIALSRDAPPAAVRFSEDLVLKTAPRVRADCGRELSRLDLQDRVEHLTVPTLVLAGERDRLTPPVHARKLAESLPECTGLVELPRTGHMAPLERPDEVTRALRDLADRRSAAPAPVLT